MLFSTSQSDVPTSNITAFLIYLLHIVGITLCNQSLNRHKDMTETFWRFVIMLIGVFFLRWLLNAIQDRKDDEEIQRKFYDDGEGPERPPFCETPSPPSEPVPLHDKAALRAMDPEPNCETMELIKKYQQEMTEKENLQAQNKELLLTTLQEMGCQPQEAPGEDRIYLKYQGENFCIDQDLSFIRIWDLPFADVNVIDTNLPLIIETINTANHCMGPTIILSDPDKNGKRNIMSRMDLLFSTFIPDPASYLAAVFNLFFQIKHTFKLELDKALAPSGEGKNSNLSTSQPFLN